MTAARARTSSPLRRAGQGEGFVAQGRQRAGSGRVVAFQLAGPLASREDELLVGGGTLFGRERPGGTAEGEDECGEEGLHALIVTPLGCFYKVAPAGGIEPPGVSFGGSAAARISRILGAKAGVEPAVSGV